jgi:hypothetical protein
MNNRTTILEFDQHRFEGHPPSGTLVIHIFGFATTKIVGFDPKEARQGKLVIGIGLSGFFIRVTLWLKTSQDDWGWVLINSYNSKFFYVSGWPYH